MDLVAGEVRADQVVLSRLGPGLRYVETIGAGNDAFRDRFSLADYPVTRRVLETQTAAQVLVDDPEAERGEVALLRQYALGALLMLPVCSQGRALGLLEVYTREPRPFTRAQINRARIICHQLAAAMHTLESPRLAVA
jgi:GAF domain-containing protein